MLAITLTIPFALLYTSVFEWVYHRYWLHRPWLPPQMFTAHTLVHHQLCKHEDTFHVEEEEQEEALTFQWWAGPVLVAFIVAPLALVAWGMHALGIALPYGAMLLTVAVIGVLYYLAYEGFHYLMHKPTFPWIENSVFFRFIKHHHRLHHVHMGKNFNVVLPLADALLGTLMIRDPHPPRPTGPEAKRVARRHSLYGRKMREEDVADAPGDAASPVAPSHSTQAQEPAEVLKP